MSGSGALAELGLGAFLGAMLRRLAPLAAGPIACGAPARSGGDREVRPGHRIALWGPSDDLGTLDLALPLAQALSALVLHGSLAPVELRPLLAIEEAALAALAQLVLAELGLAVGCEPGAGRSAPSCLEAAVATVSLEAAGAATPEASAARGVLRLALREDAWRSLAVAPPTAVWSRAAPLAVVWARLAPAAEPLGVGDVLLPAGWGLQPPERGELLDADGIPCGAVGAIWDPPALTWTAPAAPAAGAAVGAVGAAPDDRVGGPEDIVIASLFEGLLAHGAPAPSPSALWVREGGGAWRPASWCRFEGRRAVLVEA